MLKKWFFIWALMVLLLNSPVSAASVTASMLLQEAQKTSGMLDREAPPEEILAQTEMMGRMFTRLDFSKSDITLEGLQSLSSEMLGLKMRLTSIHSPDRNEVKQQLERLITAFDSLANPKTAVWKQITRDMIHRTDRTMTSITQSNRAEIEMNLQSLLASHSRIQIAMELHLPPAQMNSLNSVARFLMQQQKQMTEPVAIKEALQQYRKALEDIDQQPPATASSIKKEASRYNSQSWWIAAVLVASSGYLIYRRISAR